MDLSCIPPPHPPLSPLLLLFLQPLKSSSDVPSLFLILFLFQPERIGADISREPRKKSFKALPLCPFATTAEKSVGNAAEGETERERGGRAGETCYPSFAVMRGELLWLTFCCLCMCGYFHFCVLTFAPVQCYLKPK